MSIELDLPDYAGLLAAVERCEACGWCGVVLEYEPAFEGKAALGVNGWVYCPECGEQFVESSEPVTPNDPI